MLHNGVIEHVKVQWRYFGPNEAAWKMDDDMHAMYHISLCILLSWKPNNGKNNLRPIHQVPQV